MKVILMVARGALLVGLILFGLLGVLAGKDVFTPWRPLATGTLVYFGLSFAGGVVLASSGLVLIFKRPAILRWVAVSTAAVLFLNQTVGIWLNTLLCYTPT